MIVNGLLQVVSLKVSEQRAHTEHAEMRLRVEEHERTIAQLESLLERQRQAEATEAARRPTTTERNAVSKNVALTAQLADLHARYSYSTAYSPQDRSCSSVAND